MAMAMAREATAWPATREPLGVNPTGTLPLTWPPMRESDYYGNRAAHPLPRTDLGGPTR